MSDDPWQMLALDRGTAGATDAKSAYARLVRVHRTDKDPDAFQRVRAAYEAVLAILNGQTKDPPKSVVDSPAASAGVSDGEAPDHRGHPPSTPPASAERVTEHADVSAAVGVLRSALQTKTRQKVRDAWTQLDATCEKAQLDYESRFRHAADACSENLPLMAEVCTDERIIQHIQHDERKLPRLVVRLWSDAGAVARLAELATSLNRARHIAGTEACAMAMVETAVALGAWQPDVANRLAQKAFPHLPTDRRAELVSAVDREAAIGRVLGPLPNDHKLFWLGIFRGTTEREHWRDQDSRAALLVHLRHCGPNWPGFAILQHILKPEA